MLSDEEKRALSKVRLEHANDALREAWSMLSADHYRGACNRSYYIIQVKKRQARERNRNQGKTNRPTVKSVKKKDVYFDKL